MLNSEKVTTSRKKSVSAPVISPNHIATRAFELFSARGGVHGHDLDDWLRAERELTAPPAPKRRPTRKPAME